MCFYLSNHKFYLLIHFICFIHTREWYVTEDDETAQRCGQYFLFGYCPEFAVRDEDDILLFNSHSLFFVLHRVICCYKALNNLVNAKSFMCTI